MNALPCRLVFLDLYMVPRLPVSLAIRHRIPSGRKEKSLEAVYDCSHECRLFSPVTILQDQPCLWSCPAGPPSNVRTADRSSQCRALCGTVSRCLSTPQTLYWLTRAAPMRRQTGCERSVFTVRGYFL